MENCLELEKFSVNIYMQKYGAFSQVLLISCQREAKEALGPQLFAAVADIDQELCAQLTGMLLELPLSSLASLLTNRDELQKAARKARTEYLRFIQEKESYKIEWSDACLSEKKESIGELLYEKLLVDHPTDAAKLTGMLLQMDDQSLVKVMENSEMLKKMVETSLEALRNCDENESK
ncbi:uncharacterized protein LOC143018281 isoform X2 [Oratosquilla oratoria]|uniref:uncharacterized protein LOC143018281 isoform X2 n=1 Tax=Oratosquilla oratoria TaxID=337810 RepID=UPI003F760C7A